MRVHKLCDDACHTNDMIVYVGKDSDNATKESRYKDATVQGLTGSREGFDIYFFMDNFLPTPQEWEQDERWP
jgi:hypothetical protein